MTHGEAIEIMASVSTYGFWDYSREQWWEARKYLQREQEKHLQICRKAASKPQHPTVPRHEPCSSPEPDRSGTGVCVHCGWQHAQRGHNAIERFGR